MKVLDHDEYLTYAMTFNGQIKANLLADDEKRLSEQILIMIE